MYEFVLSLKEKTMQN